MNFRFLVALPLVLSAAACSSSTNHGSKLEARQACERWVEQVSSHTVADNTHSVRRLTGYGPDSRMEMQTIEVAPDSDYLLSRRCQFERATDQYLGFVRGNPRKIYDTVQDVEDIDWRVLRRFRY